MRVLKLAGLAFAVISAAACSEQPFPFNVSEMFFKASGNHEYIPFVMSVPGEWTSSSPDWCRLVPTSGDGLVEAVMYVETDENSNAPEGREGTIKIVTADAVKTLQVSQTYREGVTLVQDAYEVAYDCENIDITIYSTTPYTVRVEENATWWISVVQTKSSQHSYVLPVVLQENPYQNIRTGKIFVDDGFREVPITITQLGKSSY